MLKGVDGFLPYKPTAELIQSALNGPPPQSIVDGLRNPTLDKWLPPRRRKPLQVRSGCCSCFRCVVSAIIDCAAPLSIADGLRNPMPDRWLPPRWASRCRYALAETN